MYEYCIRYPADHQPDIWMQMKWEVSLVIADDHFGLLYKFLCVFVWVNILTL